MRQYEWVKKERWVGMDCGRRDITGLSVGLDRLISIRGDVDVRGIVKIVSFPTTRKTTTLAGAIFVHAPHELWRLSSSSNSISASSSDFRRVRSQTSPRSVWIGASPIRSHCESTPARRDLGGGNIIGYAMVLPIPSTSFPTESPRLVDVPIL